jgi:hypothetical protein
LRTPRPSEEEEEREGEETRQEEPEYAMVNKSEAGSDES